MTAEKRIVPKDVIVVGQSAGGWASIALSSLNPPQVKAIITFAVRVDIVEREGDGTARLQVFSPVGMYLPKPANLTVDQGQPYSVPYAWCLTNACIAGTAANPKIVSEMASGQTLRLAFLDSGLLTLTTSLPLGRFASAHKGAPAQTFEQEIDE